MDQVCRAHQASIGTASRASTVPETVVFSRPKDRLKYFVMVYNYERVLTSFHCRLNIEQMESICPLSFSFHGV